MEESFEEKVETCKKFRDETLIPERNLMKKKFKELENEISDYARLKEKSCSLNVNFTSTEPIRIPLNLGAGYSAAFEVFDKDFVLVSVGFGFYCQMTWMEAVRFCDARIDVLERRRIGFNGKMGKIEDDLKVFNELITKLP